MLLRREVDIGHNKAGPEFAWHADRVEVTPEGASRPYVFHAGGAGAPGVGAWFSSEEGHRLRRVLQVANGDLPMVKYQLLVQTGAHKYAGTEASVRVTLYGVDAATGKETRSREDIRLENAKDNFQKGKLDKFLLPPMADLGEIMKIRIGHDNSGSAAGWLLDFVEARCAAPSFRMLASCADSCMTYWNERATRRCFDTLMRRCPGAVTPRARCGFYPAESGSTPRKGPA